MSFGRWLISLFIFFSGALTGWLINGDSKSTANISEIRQSGYEFTNPLLECEYSELTKELKPFKNKVAGLINKKVSLGSASLMSVYFRDLNNGPWFGINERENFSPASLLKVAFMIAALKQAENDPGFLERQVVFNGVRDKRIPHFQPSQELTPGASYSLREIIYRMIVYSDNDAKNVLLANLKGKDLVRVYEDLGVAGPELGGPENFMSIKNYASFFRVLFNASYLNKDFSNEALRVLNDVEFKKGLSAGVPKEIKVAHKFGERIFNNELQLHDCGVIYYPGRPYLLCVMTRGKDWNQLAENVADISRLVYQEVDKQFK